MATETMTASPLDQILSLAKDLGAGARYDLAMSLLETIKSAVGGQKRRKAKDPEAPKREVKPESYIHLVNKIVWPHLQTIAEAQTDPELKARTRSVDARTQIGVLLWAPMKELEGAERVSAMEAITLEKVREAYETWSANPPAEKERKPKAQKVPKMPKIKSEGSTASDGTKSSKSSKGKLANMSEDEKAAFYKARGAAAAAARAANKATKSSAPVKLKTGKPKPMAPVEEEEPDFGEEQRAWTNPADGVTYIRQSNLLWAADDGAWVGEYNPKTKTINRDAPEPEYDE
jgi:hypothetical protein